MGWRRFATFVLIVLFLGMTVSGASATASLVNSSTNSTVKLPSGLNPQGKPGDEVQPQVGPILIFVGMILLDLLLSWALEKYVSPEAAMVYDAVSLLIPDPGDGLKLGIKVLAKHGDEITKYSIVIVKKDLWRTKVVRKITDVSASSAKWVKSALGEKYIKEIAEKYVVKRGKNFDDVVNSLKRIQSMGITSAKARRLIIDRGWDVKKLERVLSDAKSVRKGGSKLIGAINRDLKTQKDLGPLYEAEVVSHLKRSGWRIKEVEKDVVTSIGKTEIDIIAEKSGRTVYVECKRSFDGIDIGQIAKQAEYARNHGIKTIKIYYAEGPSYPPTYILQKLREISSKYNVDISLVYLGSNFN
ncbi:YraN family protein [Thermococcus thermotolerans]|uniref:YraN family protein n=1 Tax=Thermococcus thermotolerans TaxID=2969672 RepID=UPI002157FB4D|nr:YraN family protein [Thermococcus thermotolerans]